MKVKFNGIIEKTKGCNCAGKSSESVLVARKTYHLPSGAAKTFIVGRETDVLDSDGAFLLQYSYTGKDGKQASVFTEVK